jgi:hypothetical protein
MGSTAYHGQSLQRTFLSLMLIVGALSEILALITSPTCTGPTTVYWVLSNCAERSMDVSENLIGGVTDAQDHVGIVLLGRVGLSVFPSAQNHVKSFNRELLHMPAM